MRTTRGTPGISARGCCRGCRGMLGVLLGESPCQRRLNRQQDHRFLVEELSVSASSCGIMACNSDLQYLLFSASNLSRKQVRARLHACIYPRMLVLTVDVSTLFHGRFLFVCFPRPLQVEGVLCLVFFVHRLIQIYLSTTNVSERVCAYFLRNRGRVAFGSICVMTSCRRPYLVPTAACLPRDQWWM